MQLGLVGTNVILTPTLVIYGTEATMYLNIPIITDLKVIYVSPLEIADVDIRAIIKDFRTQLLNGPRGMQ